MRIICDVDNTLVRTDLVWADYLYENYDFRLEGKKASDYISSWSKDDDKLHYNLTHYTKGMGFDFWTENRGIYDYSLPVEDSIEVLWSLSRFYDIILASVVLGIDLPSKTDFCNFYVPFNKGIVITKQKWLLVKDKEDIIIDDRLENFLDKNGDWVDCNKILIDTPYEQSINIKMPDDMHIASSWSDVHKIISEKLDL